MKHLRKTGIALAAMLALMAMGGISSASASWLVSEATETHLYGEQITTHQIANAECASGLDFEDTQAEKAAGQLGPAEVQSADCGWFGELDWNECQPTFHFGESLGNGEFAGTFEIGPAGCGPVTIFKGGSYNCLIEIPAQAGLAAKYENREVEGADKVRFVADADTLEYTTSGGCYSNETRTDGLWVGSWEVDGSTGDGTPLTVQLSEQASGFHITGEESEEEGNQPKFSSETYPAIVDGAVTADNVFSTSTDFTCESGEFLSSEITGDSKLLSLAADYGVGSCIGPSGSAVTVRMNNCEYVLSLANSGPPYTGSADIVCDSEGEGVELEAVLFGSVLCTVSFPAQELGAADYEVVGEGSAREVVATITGEGLEYSREGYSGCGDESGQDGSFSGGLTLGATGP